MECFTQSRTIIRRCALRYILTQTTLILVPFGSGLFSGVLGIDELFRVIEEGLESRGCGACEEDGGASGAGGAMEEVAACGERDGAKVRRAIKGAGGRSGLADDRISGGDRDIEGVSAVRGWSAQFLTGDTEVQGAFIKWNVIGHDKHRGIR